MNLFGCNECGRFFPNQSKLNLHHRNQTLKKTCELCDIIVGAPNYSRQMKDVHSFLDSNMNKQYKCDFCTQSFTRKDNFQSHVNTHTKPSQELSCKVCTKKFKHKRYLKAHFKIHDEKTIINCTLCENTYAIKSAYNFSSSE